MSDIYDEEPVYDQEEGVEEEADLPPSPNEKLLEFAAVGDQGGVKRCSATGADLNYHDPVSGETALSLACKNAHVALVHYLLDHKADVNCRDVHGVTPLMKASFRGLPNICRALVVAGADPNIRALKGQTALLAAVQGGHMNVIEQLLKASPKIDVNVRDKQGHTVIMICSTNGRRDILQRLVEAGGDPNFVNKPTGDTPFLCATRRGDSEMLRFLAGLGADVNARDSVGRTPLIMAVEKNAVDVIDTLVEANCDLDARTFNGMTALSVAAKANNLMMVERLLKAGAQDAPDEHGVSAETVASDRGHRQVQRLLRRWKAGENTDPFSPTASGDTNAEDVFAKHANNAGGLATPSPGSGLRPATSNGNGYSHDSPAVDQPLGAALLSKASDIAGMIKRSRAGGEADTEAFDKLAKELKAIVEDLEKNELSA